MLQKEFDYLFLILASVQVFQFAFLRIFIYATDEKGGLTLTLPRTYTQTEW